MASRDFGLLNVGQVVPFRLRGSMAKVGRVQRGIVYQLTMDRNNRNGTMGMTG